MGASGTHSPSENAWIAFGSKASKVLTIIPADLVNPIEQSSKCS